MARPYLIDCPRLGARLVPDPHVTPEHQLLDRITAGDDAALGALYDVHAPVLYGFALRLTGDAAEADSVVTSVFRTVWQEPLNLRRCGVSMRAWLVGICRRAAGDRPRQPRLMSDAPPRASIVTGARDSADGVLALAGAQDILRRERVTAALEKLMPDERTALDLVYFDGLSIDDAAQRLAIPTPSARALVHSAMLTLRHQLMSAAVVP